MTGVDESFIEDVATMGGYSTLQRYITCSFLLNPLILSVIGPTFLFLQIRCTAVSLLNYLSNAADIPSYIWKGILHGFLCFQRASAELDAPLCSPPSSAALVSIILIGNSLSASWRASAPIYKCTTNIHRTVQHKKSINRLNS